MSDYPCDECGHEGRGIGAHTLSCSRQKYSGEVCSMCGERYLYKGERFCEKCVKNPPIRVYAELIDTPLKDLIARYYAGDWENDPDGGAASAIVEAYKLGRKEVEEQLDLHVKWHDKTSTLLEEATEANIHLQEKLKQESESHQETAEIMRRIREDRDRLRFYLNEMLGD